MKTSRRKFLQGAAALATSSLFGKSLSASELEERIQILFEYMKRSERLREAKGFEKPLYTSEDNPTIIIIGDIHIEEYGLKGIEDVNKLFPDNPNKYHQDGDESYQRELNAVLELKDLSSMLGLAIRIVGFEESEGYKDNFKAFGLVSQELEKKKDFYLLGLQNPKLNRAQVEFFVINYVRMRIMFLKYHSEEELNRRREELFRNQDKYNQEKIIEEVHKLNDSFTFFSIYRDIKNYDILELSWIFYLSRQFDFEEILSLEENMRLKYSKELEFSDKKFKDFVDTQFSIFNRAREQYAISLLKEKMEEDAEQIGVIIFGKAHYVGLVEEIRKQFREKVNIYVAI